MAQSRFVNDVVSEELKVPALHEDEVAVYRLIDADKDDPTTKDINGTPRKRTPGYMLSGRKKIYDPIKKRKVEIENVVTSKTIQTPMGEVVKTRPEPIRFTSDKPAITVRADQQEKYMYMERLDENADNPHRNKRVKAVYYRVDPRKKVQKDNEVSDYKLDAMLWVRRTATYNELKSCAIKVNELRPDLKIKYDYVDKEASIGNELLKRELGNLAETDPVSILKGSTNTDVILKLQIRDAINFQIVLFDKKNLKWFFNTKDGLLDITTVDPLKNSEEELHKFLKSKEGAKNYEKMCSSIQIFLTPR